jgi:GxxExxY protein
MNDDFFPLQQETYQIIGLCMEVQRTLGYGFSEIIYKDAMELEFIINELTYCREKNYSVSYKNKQLTHQSYVDFSCFDQVIVEVKSSDKGITPDHVAQVLNYLKVTGCEVGLLVNFGRRKLEYQRFILTSD